jgi:hypothetical protein
MVNRPEGEAMAELSEQDRRRIAVAWGRVWIAGNERLGRETPRWVVQMVADWDREHPLPV